MPDLGNKTEDSTFYFSFNTDLDGTPITFAGTPSLLFYKDDATGTETASGLTLSVDHDGKTGSHNVKAVLTDALLVTGADYNIQVAQGTVNSVDVTGKVLATFSIEHRFDEVDVTQWLGTAVATPTVAGVPEVDITHQGGGVIPAPAVTGVPDVNLTHHVDVAASVTNGELDTNVGQVVGTVPSLTGGDIDVNVARISGDTTSADNLENQYDGVGIVGDNFPATQSQLGQIEVTGSAVHQVADSYTLTVGTQSSGTVASTIPLDGTNHEHTDVGDAMDLYYEFLIGAGIPGSVEIHGYLNSNNDDLEVYGYDWVAPGWVQIGTLEGKNSSSNDVHNYTMFINMVGSGNDEGKVRVRFTDGAFTLSSATLAIDQIFIAFSLGGSEGYDNGAVWLDTNASNTNTVVGIDGTARNPVSTIAATLTLLASTNLNSVEVVPGSSVTLGASFTNRRMAGHEWVLDLSGEDIGGSEFVGASVSGIGTGTGTTKFVDCFMGATTLPVGAHVIDTDLEGDITLGAAGAYYFENCTHGTSAAPSVLDFGAALNASEVHMHPFHGGIEIKNMGAGSGTYLLHINGSGALVFNANCSATSTINLNGNWALTNNASGLTINDDGHVSQTTVNAQADTALTDYAGPTKTEMDSGHDLLATESKQDTAAGINTEDRLAELDAANIPADIDALPSGADTARLINPQVNTAFSNITFEMYDSSDHTPKTGLTVAGEVSLNGGAYAGVAGTVAEISDGTYQFDADAADMNGALIVFKFTATDADATYVHVKTAA